MSNVAVSFQSGIELSVVRFSVEEHMSTVFLIQLDAVGEPDIDPRAIAGKSAAFALQGQGGKRAWTGVCTRITQTQNHGEVASYTVTIAPAVWLLSRRRNYRAFQHLSVPEIAQKLLKEWGIEPVMKLEQQYPKLEYRVQYGETDYNFLRRQLAEAGISFFFQLGETADKKSEETKLVLSDGPQRNEPRAEPLSFAATALADRLEHISHVTVTSEIRPGRISMRDHDIRRPAYALFGQSAATTEPESFLEEYVYEPGMSKVAATADGATPVGDRPAAYRQTDAAAGSRARIVSESLRPGGLAVNFSTSVVDLAPGTVFQVNGHPHPAVGSERGLLVLEAWLSGETEGEWSMAAAAVPASEPFRPPQPLTGKPTEHTDEPDIFAPQLVPQKPRALGLESAIVVGPKGEEVYTDEIGRIRVQFHWDRDGQSDEQSSCFLRVSQAWAGAGYGASFVPRVGQEVLVAFVGGDPDLPVVVGRLHAPTSPVPYALPENKTRSGIRTVSSPGGDGFNEVMFEDAKGREVLSFHAQRDLHSEANNNRTARVGKADSTVAGESLSLFIADSKTGIEITRGRIVLTTGDATLVLEGGEVSVIAKGNVGVKAAQNLSTPAWKTGAPDKTVTVQPPKPAPQAPTAPAKPPVKLPVAPEQQKPQKLDGAPCVKLGKNKKYKDSILEASRRTGVQPHAIASMIDAEAAKTKTGEWNPASKATTSSATGLTQFLKGTWNQMALKKGTLLHQEALDSGYIQQTGKTFGIVPGKGDELLAMRTDPRMSIITGAEYAQGNLEELRKAGFITDATTDDEKARLAYLAHHEGLGGAKDFLRGTIPEDRAASLLRTNAGEKTAARMIKEEGSARAAYTKWLNGYMDKKIVPSRYRCTNEAVDGDEAPQVKS